MIFHLLFMYAVFPLPPAMPSELDIDIEIAFAMMDEYFDINRHFHIHSSLYAFLAKVSIFPFADLFLLLYRRIFKANPTVGINGGTDFGNLRHAQNTIRIAATLRENIDKSGKG